MRTNTYVGANEREAKERDCTYAHARLCHKDHTRVAKEREANERDITCMFAFVKNISAIKINE